MIVSYYADFRELFAASSAYDTDGMRHWASEELQTAAVKPFSTWAVSFPVLFDLSGVDDAVPFVDEWHWYLSMPTESVSFASNPFVLSRADTGAGSRSGRVYIGLTAYGTSIITASLQSASTMDKLLRDVTLYARNPGLAETYFWELHRCAFAPESL